MMALLLGLVGGGCLGYGVGYLFGREITRDAWWQRARRVRNGHGR